MEQKWEEVCFIGFMEMDAVLAIQPASVTLATIARYRKTK